jgi:hypothetical protein
MRRPLFQGSCCRRGDESFSLTMVLSSGADHSLLSAGQRATGGVIYPRPALGYPGIEVDDALSISEQVEL